MPVTDVNWSITPGSRGAEPDSTSRTGPSRSRRCSSGGQCAKTGGAIGTIVRALTKKRRGRYTGLVVAAGVILGALPSLLFNPLMIAIFMFLATGTAAAQFGTRLTINR